MIKLKNFYVSPWPYGEANAFIYLNYVLEFNSNFELFIERDNGEFFAELDIHEFLFSIDDLPTLEDKILRFKLLELSNWSMKQTFASAVCFLIQENIHQENFDTYICVTIPHHIKFFCNEIYSELLIEIYEFFDIPKVYSHACIEGCIDFFQSVNWNAETEIYLNHTGLNHFLTLLKIDVNALAEIIPLCHRVKSTVPFVDFLNKYKEKKS